MAVTKTSPDTKFKIMISTWVSHVESHIEVKLNHILDVSVYVSQQLLYEDPKRWSFSFNMYAQLTRVQMHMKKHVSSVE